MDLFKRWNCTNRRVQSGRHDALDWLTRAVADLTTTVDDLGDSMARGEQFGGGPTVSPVRSDYSARRLSVVAALDGRRYQQAFEGIEALLDEQWRVPENTYLMGIALLFTRQFADARVAIDRALGIKPWLTELDPNVGVMRDSILAAREFDPSWDWPRYRMELDSFLTLGMTTSSVFSEKYEHADVFVVQVGAFDGVHADPVHRWIKRFGWGGVLIEPQTGPYEALVDAYADCPNIVLRRAAIADRDGVITMYSTPNRPAIASVSKDRNLLKFTSDIIEFEVPAVTVESLMVQFDNRAIDILQIDAEGHDFDVLRYFDIANRGPSVINLEFYTLPIADRLELFDLLRASGYAWRFTGQDLLCVKIDMFRQSFGLFARSWSK